MVRDPKLIPSVISPIEYLEPLVVIKELLNLQMTSGIGSPVAKQLNVTESPSILF